MRKTRISLSSMHDQTKISRVQFWIRHVIYKWRVSWNNVICPFKSLSLSCWQVRGRGVKTYIGITPNITLSFLVRFQDNLGMQAILFNNHAVRLVALNMHSNLKTSRCSFYAELLVQLCNLVARLFFILLQSMRTFVWFCKRILKPIFSNMHISN